ncbi:MAG: SAM-dependent methyltransferase [Hyphomicrobiaceae bacterium]
MSYDGEARRDTPLALHLKERIKRHGPISVAAYMQACLSHPAHGYYRTRQAIGRDGDFVTAPEISQVFGELIGLWCAVVWQQMGQPSAFNFVELGPGRGTLMADALRAIRIVPGFHEAMRVWLVEPDPVLVSEQKAVLSKGGNAIGWVQHLAEVAMAPTVLIANEVLDTMPVSQLVRAAMGWRERGVGLDAAGKLVFCDLMQAPVMFLGALDARASVDAVYERRDDRALAYAMSRLAVSAPFAALLIDYGHVGPLMGESLQAVRGHRYEHPLTSPGEADVTAQVDFAQVMRAAEGWGLRVDGPITQGELLGRLGIVERASRLMASNPARSGGIETGVARLMAPGGMGGRFKALGVRSAGMAALPGLAR